MATEEKVVIKVEVDADISNDIAAIRNRLKAIEDRMGSFNRTAKNMDRGLDRVNKRFDRMGNILRKLTQQFLKFTAALAKFSFIALAGQIGLFTAGLLAAKAALVTGRAAVSAYQASLRGLSVAAAGVATAMAVAAAAMRQFNEAQLGSQFGGGPQGRLNAARATRGIGSRSAGLLGREATTAIAGSLGRAGVRPGQTGAIVRQLYNISGGDAKAAQSLAAAIGSGDLAKAQTSLRSAVGFNQGSLANVTSMRGLMGVVAGGGATGANFRSVGEDMASTFVGTLKTEFAGLTGIFADVGAPLLEPFRQAFLNISRILKEDIISLSAALNQFGAESFAPTIESFIESTSDFIRKNIIANIGNAKEMGQSFVDFGKAIKEFFADIGDFLNRLEPAANVVMDMFRALGDAAGGRGLFQQFNNLVVENAEAFKDFGASIGNVIGALFDQLSGGQMGFFNKLPLLADVFNTLANEVIPALFDVFNRFAPLMERLPGALESLANVLEMLAPIVGTLVSAVNTLLGGLQSAGGLGDIGTVALLGGMMMLTKGRGRSMLGRGGRALAGGGSGARAITSSATVGRASAANIAAINANLASGIPRSGRLGGSFLNLRNAAHTSLTGGRGAGFFGRAGKLGALALGIEGLSMIGDFRDGGFGGIASGYNQRATASPIFAGLSTGSAASFLLGPQAGFAVGGATTLLGAVNQGLAGNDSMTNRLTGAAGGAALGASIGAFGGPLGMAAGAVVGGIVGGVGTFFAGREGQKRLRAASSKAAGQVKLDIANFAVGSGSVAYNTLATQQELLAKAMEAAIDPETGLRMMEGDTREFRDYLRSIGVDPESVNRDQMFEELISDNTLNNMESRLQEAERLYTDQMEAIADQTGLSMAEVERVLNDFNIDGFTDYLEDTVAEIINLRNLPISDLNRTFLPDFSGSQQGQNELVLSNEAQLDAILNEFAATGAVSIALVDDFLGTNITANIGNGMSGPQASFAAVQALGASLIANVGEENAAVIIRMLGLHRGGSAMDSMIEGALAEFGNIPGVTPNSIANMLFGTGGMQVGPGGELIGGQTFLQSGLTFANGVQDLNSFQLFRQAVVNGDLDALRVFGMQPGVDFSLNKGTSGYTDFVTAITGSNAFKDIGANLGVTSQFHARLAELTKIGDLGDLDLGEIADLAEAFNLDPQVINAVLAEMEELPTDLENLATEIVNGVTAGGRPMVIIDGQLNTAERASATYEITTQITAGGGFEMPGFGSNALRPGGGGRSGGF